MIRAKAPRWGQRRPLELNVTMPERDIIKERTQAGLEAARARGRLGGRPKRLPSAKKVEMARRLYASKSLTVAEICRSLNISRPTLYRYIKAE